MTTDGMTNDEISLQDERDEMSFWGEEPGDAVMLLHDGPTERVYDLEERTARFGEAIIRFAMKIPRNPVNDRLISQLVGAATSVGANYCEADDGVSRKDFRKSIGTCKKEARETKHFLRACLKIRSGGRLDCRRVGHPASRNGRGLKRVHGNIQRSFGSPRCFRRARRPGSTAGEDARRYTLKSPNGVLRLALRMIAIANRHLKSEARTLWKETRELHLIFSAIWRRTIRD